MRSVLSVVLLCLAARAAHAGEAAAALAAREEALARQDSAAHGLARKQAWLAYRLARQRQLGFFGSPARRALDARAYDSAVLALGRSLHEARAIRSELAQVRSEAKQLNEEVPAPGGDREPAWQAPVRGTVVGVPGVHKDAITAAEQRDVGLTFLGHYDQPVRAPATGLVERIEARPSGGWMILLAHDGRWSSVITGLRSVAVKSGARVEPGEVLGALGRSLDGAPVATWTVFRGRAPVDVRVGRRPRTSR